MGNDLQKRSALNLKSEQMRVHLLESDVTDGTLVGKTDSPVSMGNLNKTDVGFSAGAGVTYSINKKLVMSFEVRTNSGAVDIELTNKVGYGRSMKTSAVNFLIGVAF